MTDDMTKRRDELADKRSKRQCTTGNPDLDKAIAWYLKIGFEDGFDAGVAEMQARNDSNAKSWEVAKEIEIGARFKGDYDKVCKERDSLKAQLKSKDAVIDVALKALSCYSEYCATTNRYPEIAKTTLEQIQKMRGWQDENI